MDFSEFAMFLIDHSAYHCSRQYINYTNFNYTNVTFDHVSIGAGGRSVTFSNPVMTLTFQGIIRIDKTELNDGSIRFNIICKDEIAGEEYNEEIVWSPSCKALGF